MEGLTIIDGRAAARAETGGVERWARELGLRLPALRPGGYKVAAPGERFSHGLGHLWEQLELPRVARRLKAAAILCPANLAPLAGDRNIVVVHDVAPLRFPADYSRAYSAWQHFLLPRIAKRALRVIVPSEFSRREVIEFCGVDPSSVDVVSPGVPDDVFAGADPGPVRARYGLDRPYVLTVASKVKRKNIEALGSLAERLAAAGVGVVAAGGSRPQLSPGRTAVGVRELGPVESADLPGLYAGASAFVLPSRYEGFGLPVCEAMASGVPVVTTTAASLPEAAAGAALLVDPDDVEGLERAVLSVLEDAAVRDGLILRGNERVAGLTWQATAAAVDSVVRKAIA